MRVLLCSFMFWNCLLKFLNPNSSGISSRTAATAFASNRSYTSRNTTPSSTVTVGGSFSIFECLDSWDSMASLGLLRMSGSFKVNLPVIPCIYSSGLPIELMPAILPSLVSTVSTRSPPLFVVWDRLFCWASFRPRSKSNELITSVFYPSKVANLAFWGTSSFSICVSNFVS